MIFYVVDSNNKLVETIQSPEELGMGGITALTGIVEEKLDTYELLDLTVPADSKGLENIKEDMTIIFNDISGWREYVIYEIEDEDNGKDLITSIRAELSSSELIDEVIETNLSSISTHPKTVLEKLLEGTRFTVGHVDSSVYSQAFNVNTTYMNVLEALTEYAKKYSAEVRFSYQVNGNKVVKRSVDVYKQYGEYKGKIFEIDRDMTSVKRTVNTELVKTTIIPYSKELEVDPEDSENDETYRLDISGVEWKKSNGDPVDKPLGQNYLVDPVALNNWGKTNADGSKRHKKISMEFDFDNAESIISMAWVQLGRYTQPKATYEVKAIDLYAMTNDERLKHEQILLGDTGGVKDHYFTNPIEIQTRLVEVKRDLFDSRNNDYVFGTSKQIFSANTAIEKAEEVAKSVDEIELKLKDYQTTIDGRNRVFRGSNNPVEPLENDIWFRPHPSKQGHTQMLVHNGASWVIEADSSDLEDAGRLKTGTIDAAEVNVINLIADNITGGQLKLETGLEITNKGQPILSVNSAGEVEFNVSKLTISARNVVEELDRIDELDSNISEQKQSTEGISLLDKDTQSGNPVFTDKADDNSVVHVGVDGKSVQDGEPTPDYPIPIQSVNDVDIVSDKGRNLLKVSDLSNTSITSTKEMIISDWANGFVLNTPMSKFIETGKEYTFSFEAELLEMPSGTTLYSRDVGLKFHSATHGMVDGIFHTTSLRNVGDKERVVGTFTAPDMNNGYRLLVYTQRNTNPTTFGTTKFTNVKIERGSTPTPYSQAPEDIQDGETGIGVSKINLLLDEPLRNVRDVKDRLFRDSDGLWKVERNVEEAVLNGSENWLIYGKGYYTSLGSTKAYNPTAISTHFKFSNGEVNIPVGLFYLNGAAAGSWNGNITFGFDNAVGGTTNFKQWLSTNPVTVQYDLDVPFTETLSDELQDKLNHIASFKDSNYVYTMGENDLKPTLHATFKGGGWAERFRTALELEKKAASEHLDELAELVTDINSAVQGKADLGEIETLKEEYDKRMETEETLSAAMNQVLTDMGARTTLLETIAGENKLVTTFVDTYISEADEGIFIGDKIDDDSPEGYRMGNNGILIGHRIVDGQSKSRISFMNGGEEVASITDQMMKINHGVFVQSLTIDGFLFQKIPGTNILSLSYGGA